MVSAAIFFSSMPNGSSAQDVNPAYLAFEAACLNGDTSFRGWQKTMRSFGLANAGRAQNRQPPSFPSGDAIVYNNSNRPKSGGLRSCNVLVKGDDYNAAKKFLRAALRKQPWRSARKSNKYYIPSNREFSDYSKSFDLGNGTVLLIFVRTTIVGGFGVLTAMNADVINATP